MIITLRRVCHLVRTFFITAIVVAFFYSHLMQVQEFFFSRFSLSAAMTRIPLVLFGLLGFSVKALILWMWGCFFASVISAARDRNADMSFRTFIINGSKFFFAYLIYYVVGYFINNPLLSLLWSLIFLLVVFRRSLIQDRRYNFFTFLWVFVVCSMLSYAAVFVDSFVLGWFAKTLVWILLCVLFAGKEKLQRRVIVVNPLWGGVFGAIAAFLLSKFPAFYIVLASRTDERFSLNLVNCSFWSKYSVLPGDLVAITSFSANAYRAYKIAKEAKQRGATVILGGPHVSAFIQEAHCFCDAVVVGEAESVWTQLLEDYESNELKQVYKGEFLDDNIDAVYEQLEKSPLYQAQAYVESTRGCKFRCEHCTIPFVSSTTIRHSSLDKLLEHIGRLSKKYKHITFLDNNIYSDPVYSRKLFEGLKKFNITWDSAISIDIASNDEDLKLAYDSGARNFLIGFELVEAQQDKHKQGKFAYMKRYQELTKKIKKYGIKLKAGFIYGFDNCDFAYVKMLLKFVYKINAHLSVLFFLTPFPGTKLYERLLCEDRILNLNWKKYDTHFCTILPKKMPAFAFRACFEFTRFIICFCLSSRGRLLFLCIIFYFIIFWR